nr:hypothetical protein [Rhizobium jaguaris]
MANTDLIPASLLARKAVVNVRQSTQPKVMSNLESSAAEEVVLFPNLISRFKVQTDRLVAISLTGATSHNPPSASPARALRQTRGDQGPNIEYVRALRKMNALHTGMKMSFLPLRRQFFSTPSAMHDRLRLRKFFR